MNSFLKTHWRFWVAPLLLGGGLIVAASILLMSLSAPAALNQQKDPDLTVTVTPESPTTYEKTSITIHITNTKALGGTPSIVDETRGMERGILWAHPVDEYKETLALTQLFPKDNLPLDNQITLRVTIKDRKGRETIITRVVTFEREDSLRTVQ